MESFLEDDESHSRAVQIVAVLKTDLFENVPTVFDESFFEHLVTDQWSDLLPVRLVL